MMAFFHSVLLIMPKMLPVLLCSVQGKSDSSFAQTTSSNRLYHRLNFGLDTFRRSLDLEN